MMEWEYQILRWDARQHSSTDVENALNHEGDFGWEVVSVKWSEGGTIPISALLKRLKRNG